MDTKPAFYIISAARKGATNNAQRHDQLTIDLARLGAIKPVEGCFEGNLESAFLVIENPLAGEDHSDKIRKLLILYSQQCALFVDCNRGAWYLFPQGHSQYLGQWTTISKPDPDGSYTVDPVSGYTYGIK